MPPPDENDFVGKQFAARDEILQVMYWLRGEGIATEASAQDLVRWVGLDLDRKSVV